MDGKEFYSAISIMVYMSGWTETHVVDTGESTIKITLMGDPGGGKTSITRRLVGKTFDKNEKLTVGANYIFHSPPDVPDLKLKICDIAGQASFRSVRKNYLLQSDGALLIFDLTNPDSFANIIGWMKEYIDANKDTNAPRPILLIGNKSDLEQQRQVSLKMVKQFLKGADEAKQYSKNIIGYLETSAKTGHNIVESFVTLTDRIRTNAAN